MLEEIRSKQQIMGVLPLAIGASVIGFIAFLLLLEAPGAEAVKWGMLAAWDHRPIVLAPGRVEGPKSSPSSGPLCV